MPHHFDSTDTTLTRSKCQYFVILVGASESGEDFLLLFHGVLLCSHQKSVRYKREPSQTKLIDNQMIESKIIDIMIRATQKKCVPDEQFIRPGLRIPND